MTTFTIETETNNITAFSTKQEAKAVPNANPQNRNFTFNALPFEHRVQARFSDYGTPPSASGNLRFLRALASSRSFASAKRRNGGGAIFVISGFYMQLVLQTRYNRATLGRAWVARFYAARYFRLLPAYAAGLPPHFGSRAGQSPNPFPSGLELYLRTG